MSALHGVTLFQTSCSALLLRNPSEAPATSPSSRWENLRSACGSVWRIVVMGLRSVPIVLFVFAYETIVRRDSSGEPDRE